MTKTETITKKEIEAYENTKCDFVDYSRFEGDFASRESQKEEFINDRIYTPEYPYPKLKDFSFDEKTIEKKSNIYEAVLELEAAKANSCENPLLLEFYASNLEARLKKILLVEAARDLDQVQSSSDWEVAEKTFQRLNIEVYGEFNVPTYKSIMATENGRVADFSPKTKSALHIKEELQTMLDFVKPTDAPEKPLMADEDFDKLHKTVMERYRDIFDQIPETDDSVYYDASECEEIINKTLRVSGLAKSGWLCEINPLKSNPSTSKSRIFLPSNTRRNASELRRLVIHEQEVHARRAQNGKKTKVEPLFRGTADYLEFEDGLAVLLECAVAGNWDNASFNRARDRYITAGLALGVDGETPPRNARQVHDVLWRILAIRNSKQGVINDEGIRKAKESAYTHVENAFRGTAFWMSGVIYSKLKIYYEGLIENANYFKENINNLDEIFDNELFLGKYNHTNPEEKKLVHTVIDLCKK